MHTSGLNVERLEARELPAIASATLLDGVLTIRADDSHTSAVVESLGATLGVRDVATGRTWRFAGEQVTSVEFVGGARADRFVNNVPSLVVTARG